MTQEQDAAGGRTARQHLERLLQSEGGAEQPSFVLVRSDGVNVSVEQYATLEELVERLRELRGVYGVYAVPVVGHLLRYRPGPVPVLVVDEETEIPLAEPSRGEPGDCWHLAVLDEVQAEQRPAAALDPLLDMEPLPGPEMQADDEPEEEPGDTDLG